MTHDNTGLPVMLQTSTGQSAMYVYDGQNNPVSLTTETSATAYVYAFDPYGGATLTQNSGGTGSVQNPYVYGGGLQDRSTGLIKFGQRWYDPTLGTWTQQDTLNAPLDPGNANRYSYVGGNPINPTDPIGESIFDPLVNVGGRIGSFVANNVAPYGPSCGAGAVLAVAGAAATGIGAPAAITIGGGCAAGALFNYALNQAE